MKRTLLIPFFMILISLSGFSQNYELTSPDGKVEVEISVNDETYYSVYFKGDKILDQSSLALKVRNHGTLGEGPSVLNSSTQTVDETIEPVVYEKRSDIRNRYNELSIEFENPLQMLSDSPNNYREEKECTEFISDVPVVWDDTKVLEGEIGEYLILARKKDDVWYVGAMTDWSERDLEVDLSFLDSGNYKVELFRDGINADRHAEDYKKETITVNASDDLNIHMAPGGGWVAKLKKE